MSGVQLEPLIRGCERPGQAVLRARADGACRRRCRRDRPARTGGCSSTNGWPGAALHRPVDRPGEQVHPVAGLLARRGAGRGAMLASSPGRNRSSSSESRRHSSNIACISASRSGPGSCGWPSPWNSARCTISTPMSLNMPTKSGVDRGPPFAFSCKRRHGGRHVPVAGERVIARAARGSDRRACIGASRWRASLGVARGEQVEDAQALLGAGRGVEPGDERAATASRTGGCRSRIDRRARDAPGRTRRCCRLSVRSRGKKNWCGGGKQATEPAAGLGDQACDAGRPGGDPRRPRLRPRRAEASPRCRPRRSASCPAAIERQAGVVEDRPPILLGANDRLDVHQAGTAVDRELELARERPDREVADRDGRAVALAGDADPLQVELRPVRLKRPLGRRVEEDVEDAHLRRPARRGLARADQQERHRVRRLAGRAVGATPIERISGWPGRRSSTTSPVSGRPVFQPTPPEPKLVIHVANVDPALGAITREIDARLGRGQARDECSRSPRMARAVIRKCGGIMDVPLSSADSRIGITPTFDPRCTQINADEDGKVAIGGESSSTRHQVGRREQSVTLEEVDRVTARVGYRQVGPARAEEGADRRPVAPIPTG